MKLLLLLTFVLVFEDALISQSNFEQKIIGTWKEGRSLTNGCADTTSQYLKYHTGANGHIWKFSHDNLMISWEFTPKGKFNKYHGMYQIIATDTNNLLRFVGGQYDLIIIRLTAYELWVAPSFEKGNYQTFYKNER